MDLRPSERTDDGKRSGKLDFGVVPDASPPPSTTYLSVIEWFESKEWSYDSSAEHDSVGSTIRLKDCAVRLRCSVYHQDDWRRVTAYAVFHAYVPENRRTAMAEALARINYSLAVGAFNLDMSDGEVSARNWHSSDTDINLEMIDRTANRALNLAEKFFPALMAVAFGGASPKDVLELANRDDETVQ